METIDVFVPTGVNLVQHTGPPPADQSAEVADLTQKLAQATDALTSATNALASANNMISDLQNRLGIARQKAQEIAAL